LGGGIERVDELPKVAEEEHNKKQNEGREQPGFETGKSNEILRSLATQFNDPCLKSSSRVLILFSLALNKRLGFVDLLNLTGLGKGSLSNHLEKLESSGYVITKSTMSFSGPRVMVEITQKGLEAYSALMRSLKELAK
jgi:DNA-binding MarR family transcriptional regulator